MKFDEIFNLDELPESTSNEPIPAGEYTVEIERAEVRQTKRGDGSYVSIMYRVISETRQNACVFGNLNIHNTNPTAEKIGRQQLGSLMRAVGLVKLVDTDELIGKQLIIKVSSKEDEQYGDRNEIKSWKSLNKSVPKDLQKPKTPVKSAAPWIAKNSNHGHES